METTRNSQRHFKVEKEASGPTMDSVGQKEGISFHPEKFLRLLQEERVKLSIIKSVLNTRIRPRQTGTCCIKLHHL